MPCVKQGSYSQRGTKGSAALWVQQRWRGEGSNFSWEGFHGLSGTTGLVLPALTPGRAFLLGSCGCGPGEGRVLAQQVMSAAQCAPKWNFSKKGITATARQKAELWGLLSRCLTYRRLLRCQNDVKAVGQICWNHYGTLQYWWSLWFPARLMEATWSLSPKLSFPNHLFQCITKDRLLQIFKSLHANSNQPSSWTSAAYVHLNNAVSRSRAEHRLFKFGVYFTTYTHICTKAASHGDTKCPPWTGGDAAPPC